MPLRTTVTLAHSPDADDAFMFYALANKKIDTDGLCFIHELHNIETLNRRAIEGVYDVTAISFHAYPLISKNYALLSCGSSVGDNYGPIIVSKKPIETKELKGKVVAIPGTLTTAFLTLKLFDKNIPHKVIPFDKIPDAVASGEVDAGVLIHEGQVNFESYGLCKVLDLGKWWYEDTGLPLPLGGNAIKRNIETDVAGKVISAMKHSIEFALAHRDDALSYAMKFSRDIGKDKADKFVSMYVNNYTLDLGERGKEAVMALLRKGFEAGIIKDNVDVKFLG